ncbi:MAG: hypothetical protein QOJ35_657 [Solirubrobacteraceae bacterium]|jgi:hypothetical protein|nr:hypothetical protein [Solirubrobacteraceae bacterium]
MSTPAVDRPQAPGQAFEQCAACGAPLAHDQRYCLHCGELRAGARRPMPAALRGPIDAPAARVVDVAAPARVGPSLGAVLAGFACLLLAMGIGVLIGRGGGEPAAQAPLPVAAADASAGAPAAASFTSDWPAGSEGWTVALELLPKATTTPAAVAQAKTAAARKGAPAVGALDADAHPSLTGGSYVVYSGVFDTEKAAADARGPLLAAFAGARVVRVGRSAATSAAGAPGKGTSASPARGSSSTKTRAPAAKDSGASDTTKAFEKSKKAPKTVGTGGTPPPKDHKPAAGGGGFQEIG